MKVSELFTYAVVISTQLATALPASSIDEGQDDQPDSGIAEFAGALDARGSNNGIPDAPANGVGNVSNGAPSTTGVLPGNEDADTDLQTAGSGEDNGASDDAALGRRGKAGKAQAAKKGGKSRGRGRGKKGGKRRVKKGTRTRARKGGKRGRKGKGRRGRKGGKRGARANGKNNKTNKRTRSNNHRRTDLDQADEQVRQEQQLDAFQPFSGVQDFLQERGADFVFVKRDGQARAGAGAGADDTADDAAILFARQHEGEDSGVLSSDEGSVEAEAAAPAEPPQTDGEPTDGVISVSASADGNEQQEQQEPAAIEASATTDAAVQEVGALAEEDGDGLDD